MLLASRIDMQGRLNGRLNAQLNDAVLLRLQAQVSPDTQNSFKADVDYKGGSFCAGGYFMGNGLLGASYLQSVSDGLALGAEGLSQHVTHRDGGAIAHTWHVRRLMWRHALVAPWQKGDLIFIDNWRVAHARMPFRSAGPRKLWVAWTRD